MFLTSLLKSPLFNNISSISVLRWISKNIKGKVAAVFNLLGTTTWRHTGDGGIAPPLLTSALGRCEWSVWRPVSFTPAERAPRYQLDERLVGPQNQFKNCRIKKNTFPYRKFNPRCPACSLSLYWLSYPGSIVEWNYKEYYKLLQRGTSIVYKSSSYMKLHT
jgi:hypothetical protein